MRASYLLLSVFSAMAIAGIALAVTSLPQEKPSLSFVPADANVTELEPEPASDVAADEVAPTIDFPIVIANFGGQVPIVVGASERPRFLYLHAHRPTIWRLHLMPGANVRRIYAYSGYVQSVQVFHVDQDNPVMPPIIDLDDADLEAGIPNFHMNGGVSDDPERRGEANARLIDAVKTVSGGYDPTRIIQQERLRGRQAFALDLSEEERNWLAEAEYRVDRSGDLAEASQGDVARARRDLVPLAASGVIDLALPDFGASLETTGPTAYHNSRCGDVLMGGAIGDTLICNPRDTEPRHPPPWIVSGAGDDIIGFLHRQDTVMVSGPGDDLLVPDTGNHLIYLSKGWGHDRVWSRCFEELGSPTFVIGADVDPDNLEWVSEKLLRDGATGDSLAFAWAACGRFVTAEGRELHTPFAPPVTVAPLPLISDSAAADIARSRSVPVGPPPIARMPTRDRVRIVPPPSIVPPPPVAPPRIRTSRASEGPADRSPPQ